MSPADHASRIEALTARLWVEDTLHRYADTIDTQDFESWSDMFPAHGSYRLTSRSNEEKGLPISLMDCPSKDWIVDRATSILHATMYSPHWYRHLYGNFTVRPLERGRVEAGGNYAVYRTDTSGDTDLLSVGRASAVLVMGSEAPIEKMTVTYDTLRLRGVVVFPL